MNNVCLEIQKIVVNSARNIDFLQQNDIKIFASIPYKTKIPYIKIASISMNKTQNIADINTFTIDLFVATEGKNNCQVIEIMEQLYQNLSSEIINYITNNNDIKSKIFNVYNCNYTIYEDLQNNAWDGHFYVDIDVKKGD